ncbi:MAG: hypothetical protein A3A98_02260 [Candidatus Staskawiczbacteria bacterium RIFCSPLOWO2_01_FULL_40_39]|uniref:Terminase small subunit n=1 Tax=Candidatus Staskawiczbacteria bacterium RIFCSPHIGHO2_01_FULL_39_25 TaxID=1802202 RepID=A0A1G2HQJ8_9BACT|nr:MAG: hypothetical protein A2730_03870 [Candidatus Staskawiczbacteria bacterium RIFCSPHIGHO2_01_FULL_39_25]OGZ74072.1 MAG: hypothetical protein A3A98_02260 [Candidatus Staskawiczbacteria bacterium RIFCSPLOWO2_01_FULL_40_39]
MEEYTKNLSLYNKEIALKRELFCRAYTSNNPALFGNGTQAYLAVYGKGKQMSYRAARTCASRLLTSANIRGRINELLEGEGLNDEFVDKQLLFLAAQFGDLKVKLGAVIAYNKFKRRIETPPSPASILDVVSHEQIVTIARRVVAQADGKDSEVNKDDKFGLSSDAKKKEIPTKLALQDDGEGWWKSVAPS